MLIPDPNPNRLVLIEEVEEALLVDLTHRVLRDLRHHAHLVRYIGFFGISATTRTCSRARGPRGVGLREEGPREVEE